MLTPTRALSHRYDPEISISDEISTESDRVLFLKSTAKIMLSKARVKLNLKGPRLGITTVYRIDSRKGVL